MGFTKTSVSFELKKDQNNNAADVESADQTEQRPGVASACVCVATCCNSWLERMKGYEGKERKMADARRASDQQRRFGK